MTSTVTHEQTGKVSEETRLFVSSAERATHTLRQRLARCRGHWKVESGNHYRRDVTWREDRELGRNTRRACNLALIRPALPGALLRDDGALNLFALSQRYASQPALALRFLRSLHPQP